MILKLSDTLLKYLGAIDSPAKSLLTSNVAELPFNYLDLSIKDKTIQLSYLPTERIKDAGWDLWNSPLRQAAKIGKALNKLNNATFTENDVRQFTESLLALADTSTYQVKVVEGSEIGRIYRIPKAGTVNPNHTRPFGSCFQGTLTEKQCVFWDNNPEVVKMISVWAGEKLAGRALYWIGKIEDEVAPRLDNIFSGFPQARTLILKKANELGALNNLDKGWYHENWKVVVTDEKGEHRPPYFDFVTCFKGVITLKKDYVNYLPDGANNDLDNDDENDY